MTQDELLKIQKDLSKDAGEIMAVRNREYAQDEDSFSNFKTQSEFIGISIEKVLLLYLKENLDRLRNMLLKGVNDPKQIRDKTIDMMNYSVLYYAWFLEQKEGKK